MYLSRHGRGLVACQLLGTSPRMTPLGEKIMQSADTNRCLTLSVEPKPVSTKLAGAAIRSALTLALCSALLLIPRPVQAQEAPLYSFQGSPDGAAPLALVSDGTNIYGPTLVGGTSNVGSVFELSPPSSGGSGGWTETIPYSFNGQQNGDNAANPGGAFFLIAGDLYGEAEYGPDANDGDVAYQLAPPGEPGAQWAEYTLESTRSSGVPALFTQAGSAMDQSGNLYTVAAYSLVELVNPGSFGTPWVENTICNLSSSMTVEQLALSPAGNIFGIAYDGGWALYEFTPGTDGNCTQRKIHGFTGEYDAGSFVFVFDATGNIYGTAQEVGPTNVVGTVYKLSLGQNGKYTYALLHSFKGSPDGSYPSAIVLGKGGNIFGTTYYGGDDHGWGIVFELVAPVGEGSYREKILWTFGGDETGDGGSPNGLIVGSDGNLYGTTLSGGSAGLGTVFEVNLSANATTTVLKSSPNPSIEGDAVTFTATVTPAPPDGEIVTFMNGPASLGTVSLSSGTASFAISTLPVGTSSITAVYGGDLNYFASTSKVLKQVVKN